jgi:hypothetical protein
MKLENILYGLRTALDNPLLMFSVPALTVPFAMHETPESLYVFGFAAANAFVLYANALAYNDIDERIKNNRWDAGLVQGLIYRQNLRFFVQRHPEHQARYELLEQELFPNRSRE